MTLVEFLEKLLALGPSGLLGAACYLLWRERNALQVLLLAEKQARLDDSKAGTTALLAVVERVHETIDKLEDRP